MQAKLKLKKSEVLAFLLAVFLYPPVNLNLLSPILDTIVDLGQIVSALIMIALGVLKLLKPSRKRTYTNVIVILIVLFYIEGLFSALVINKRSFSEIPIVDPLVAIALTITFIYEYRNTKNSFINGFLLYFEWITVLQILCQIIYPNGMFTSHGFTQNWILGYKNYPARFLLPGALFSLLWSMKEKGKITSRRTLIDLILINLVVFVSLSSTGIIGIVFFDVLIFVGQKRGLPKFFSIKNLLIASIVFFGLMFFIGIQSYFSYLIIVVFQKDLSFAGRTYVWEKAFSYFLDNPIFGIGLRSDYTSLLAKGGYSYAHAHQYFLQILMTGGLIGFILTICMYVLTGNKLKRIRNKNMYVVFTATMAAYLIMGLDEALTNANMIIPILALGYEVCKMEEAKMLSSLHRPRPKLRTRR